MADPLFKPQEIAATYDESALLALSLAQNGIASIGRVEDGKGSVVGFTSAYALDLSKYEAPTPPVPAIVSSAQAKIQCMRTPGSATGKTLLDDITAAVNATGGEAKIWFTDARTWSRDNSYFATLSAGLNLTPEQVDTLFVEAAKISA